MNNYIQVKFRVAPLDEVATDVLAALLADVGFESFVPDDTGMAAYAPRNLFDAGTLSQVIGNFPLDGFSIQFDVNEIEGKDWNSEWEKNYFKPIILDDRCVIHSSFHTDIPKVQYDIVIDPQMAFGTGYHQTTTHMLRAILDNDVSNSSLLDMGCGTALLAILARMRGAGRVVAIDIDEFAYENAKQNIILNNTPDIDVRLGGVDAIHDGEQFDYVIANINRNILLADMGCYASHMHQGSKLFISGFYTGDIEVLCAEAARHGLAYQNSAENDNWAMISFVKNI